MSEESLNLLEKLSDKQSISEIYSLTLRVRLLSNSRGSSRIVGGGGDRCNRYSVIHVLSKNQRENRSHVCFDMFIIDSDSLFLALHITINIYIYTRMIDI